MDTFLTDVNNFDSRGIARALGPTRRTDSDNHGYRAVDGANVGIGVVVNVSDAADRLLRLG